MEENGFFQNMIRFLHVAAIVHQKEQPDMETLYYNVNTKLTVELAEKAKKEHVPQFIFFQYYEYLRSCDGEYYRGYSAFTNNILWKK